MVNGERLNVSCEADAHIEAAYVHAASIMSRDTVRVDLLKGAVKVSLLFPSPRFLVVR